MQSQTILNIDDIDHCLELANYYLAKENYSEAISFLDKLFKLSPIGFNPTHASIYQLRGNAHFHLGNMQNAIRDYTHAISLDSANKIIHYSNRATAYYFNGDFKNAIKDFNKVLEVYPTLDPGVAMTFNILGILHQFIGEFSNAIKCHGKAIRIDPQNTGYHSSMMQACQANAYTNCSYPTLFKTSTVQETQEVNEAFRHSKI